MKSENDLAKMFLMSYDTYDKLSEQIKENSSLRLLNDQMQNTLKKYNQLPQDKWLKYRQDLVKYGEQKRENDTDDMSDKISAQLKNKISSEMVDNSMTKIMKNGKIPDKWLRYRNLLFRKGLQKNAFNDKNLDKIDYKQRAKSVKILNTDLRKILNNRRMRNDAKWLKYRHLLHKHGLHKLENDDVELEHAIWADKLNKNHRNAQVQTDKDDIEKSLAALNISKKNFATQTDESIYTKPSEIIYTLTSPVKSPETDEEERENQKKYLSANRNARRLLLRRDIENNTTNINPDDIDNSETDWQMKSLLTEDERDMLQPKAPALIKATKQLHSAVDKMANATPVNRKKIKKKFLTLEDLFSSMNREEHPKREERSRKVNDDDDDEKFNVKRRLDYKPPLNETLPDFDTPPARSTPKTREKKLRGSVNTTLNTYYKSTKSPYNYNQKGKGRLNILRWDRWHGS